MNVGLREMNRVGLSAEETTSDGISLLVHGIVITLVMLDGAFGSFMGLSYTSVSVWAPISLIVAYSFFTMLNPRKAVTFVPNFRPIIIAMYIFVIWRLIGFFWSSVMGSTFKECLKTIYLFVFVTSTFYALTRASRKKLLKMICYVVTISLIASLISYLYQLLMSGGFKNYASKDFKAWITLFYSGNTAGAVVLMLGLWNWMLVFSGGRYLKIGLMNSLVALFLLLGIASQAALGGFLASISCVVFYYFYTIRHRMFLFYISNVITMALALFSIYYVVESTTIKGVSTLHGRVGIWIVALDVLKGGKWLGGIGSGAAFWLTSVTDIGAMNVHNLLIHSLASGGIIELTVVLFVFAWLARMALPEIHGTGIVLLAYVAGAFVRCQAESGGFLFGYLNNSWTFLSWYVVISIIVLMQREPEIDDESAG